MEKDKDENFLNCSSRCNDKTFCPETKSTCFLCLQDGQVVDAHVSLHQNVDNSARHASIKLEKDVQYHYLEKISLQSIIRYFRISLKEIFATGFSNDNHAYSWSSKKILEDQISNFLVPLCIKCSKIVANLSDLCIQLELLQMKLGHCLKSFSDLLCESADKEQAYKSQNNISIGSVAEKVNRRAIEILRKEMSKKCETTLDRILPKVMVRKEKVLDEMVHANTGRDTNIEKTSSLFQKPHRPHHQAVPATLESESDIDYNSSSSLNSDDEPTIPKKRLKATQNRKSQSTCSRKVSKRKSHKICHLCSPPRQVRTGDMKRHKIVNHLETLLISCKRDDFSISEFKEYCHYVLQVELLSSVTKHDSDGNPCLGCPNCPKVYQNRDNLRLHVYSAHKEILARKVVELQRSTTFDELRSIQLPASCMSQDDVWKCGDCGGTFTHHSSLAKHKKNRCVFSGGRKAPDKKFRCDICSRYFVRRHTLNRHRLQIHGKPLQEKRKLVSRKDGLSPARSKKIEDDEHLVVIPKVKVELLFGQSTNVNLDFHPYENNEDTGFVHSAGKKERWENNLIQQSQQHSNNSIDVNVKYETDNDVDYSITSGELEYN